MKSAFACLLTFLIFNSTPESLAEKPTTSWTRHVIDDSLRGADGVRLADFNGDGLADVVTGWEESGIVRLYLHPGVEKVKQVWPAVTVGEAKSPEDAVAFDFDGDGKLDVVSCHEGKTRQAIVHLRGTGDLLAESNWKSQPILQLNGQLWMFAVPVGSVDGRDALVLGSKGGNASITLLVAPPESRANMAQWRELRLRDAGWIMSLQAIDMDGDGDLDVVFSDRKGSRRGVGWLEHPNDSETQWAEHAIGGSQYEVMFIDASRDRVLVSTRNSVWVDYRRSADGQWTGTEHRNPESIMHGKAIKRLSKNEIVMTANTRDGKGDRVGLWLSRDGKWEPIGTATQTKFDRIECIDLDGDGDLDVMTCEERRNLGVVWYENPER